MPDRRLTIFALAGFLAGCNSAQQPAGDAVSASPGETASAPQSPVGPDRFIAIGTEPFWNAVIADGKAKYSTPENPDGTPFPVNALQDGAVRQFSGTLDGQPFVLRLRPQVCSDGMSDRSYGHSAELAVAGEMRKGCADPGTEFKNN